MLGWILGAGLLALGVIGWSMVWAPRGRAPVTPPAPAPTRVAVAPKPVPPQPVTPTLTPEERASRLWYRLTRIGEGKGIRVRGTRESPETLGRAVSEGKPLDFERYFYFTVKVESDGSRLTPAYLAALPGGVTLTDQTGRRARAEIPAELQKLATIVEAGEGGEARTVQASLILAFQRSALSSEPRELWLEVPAPGRRDEKVALYWARAEIPDPERVAP